MDAIRWGDVRALFGAALERDPGQRTGFLAGACRGDGELHGEVDRLLAAHARDSGLFASQADADASGEVDELELDLRPGQRIGPYRIGHLLGRGGMGAVYLATRADGEYRKRVALKVLRSGFASADLARRFRRERQILAALDHPFIARLLDGGTTDDGRPYLVLEHVDGLRLDRFCAEAQPSLPDRLDLFRSICAAVQFAHQNLVVHRDLKPGNILVTAGGMPKLLDFGISTLLNPELGDDTLVPTALGRQPMTPDYASPEQFRGEAITTASDVYALGLLLYEMVAGVHPFRRPGETAEQLVRRVARDEPARPSEGARRAADGPPASWAHRLRGDLDAIVLKALRKEPARRYPSVEHLAEDVHRHLRGQPVAARRGTRGYLFGKWVRRHRLAVAAVTAALAASLGFGTLMALQARDLARERDRAETEGRRAEQVKGFLVGLFEVADPVQATGETITAREVLDRGVERLATDLADQPEVRADLLSTVGRIYRRLGLYDRARRAFEQALRLRRGVFAAASGPVAESLSDLGVLHAVEGRYPEAGTLLEEALAVRRQLLGERHPAVVDAIENLGLLAMAVGDFAKAEGRCREALALRRDALADDPSLATSLLNLGAILNQLGRHDEAAALLRESLELLERQHGRVDLRVALAQENLGVAELGRGRLDEALDLQRAALATRETLLGSDDAALAGSHVRLGLALVRAGDLAAALADFQRAVALRGGMDADDRLALESRTLVAQTLARMGEPEHGERLAREVLADVDRSRASAWFEVAEAQSVLGECLAGQGRHAEAEPLLAASERALAPLGDAAPSARDNLERLARLYDATGRTTEASQVEDRLALALADAQGIEPLSR